MHKSIAILGRQPALGISEYESLYGDNSVVPFGQNAALLSLEHEEVDFKRLGGSIRLSRTIKKLDGNDWKNIEKVLVEFAPEYANSVDGKFKFGISVYGIEIAPRKIANTALLMKKAIRQSGKSVRMVPHNDKVLGAAVVIHNGLVKDSGCELLVVSNGNETYLAQTTNIQDIEAYTARDRKRPKRDAKVGMLPPKLAQIIVNLASGNILDDQNSAATKTVLDPFCGTGVLLQEALLMGYDVIGSDIESRMIEYSEANLKWLEDEWNIDSDKWSLAAANATKHKWDEFDTVASETFLGHPLSSLPPGDHLSKIIYEANVINHRFLQNLSNQLSSGTRICIAMPTWRGKHEFLHLPLLDHLTDMGYTRLRLKHVSNEDLIYHREGQVVGRELLVLKKD